MNKELIMVFLPGISWILFALGGTQISDKVKGWKGWRRFILPFVYFLFCFFNLSLSLWWRGLIVAGIAGIVYSLPYGEKLKSWLRWLVAGCYGLISVPLGLSWWNPITALGFMVLFNLSNWKITSNVVVWKVCEGFLGQLCGIQLAYILMGKGWVW